MRAPFGRSPDGRPRRIPRRACAGVNHGERLDSLLVAARCERIFRQRNFQLLYSIRHGRGLDCGPCPRPSPSVRAPAAASSAPQNLATPRVVDEPRNLTLEVYRALADPIRLELLALIAARWPDLRLPPARAPALQPVPGLEASRDAPPRRSRDDAPRGNLGLLLARGRGAGGGARVHRPARALAAQARTKPTTARPRASSRRCGRLLRRSRPRRSEPSRSSSPAPARSWSTRRPATPATSASP